MCAYNVKHTLLVTNFPIYFSNIIININSKRRAERYFEGYVLLLCYIELIIKRKYTCFPVRTIKWIEQPSNSLKINRKQSTMIRVNKNKNWKKVTRNLMVEQTTKVEIVIGNLFYVLHRNDVS